jgi:transcriptional regulator with XRE-family HTH domain
LLTGKELKIKRIKNDIMAKEISESLNVTKAYVSMLENGKQRIPEHIYRKWTYFLKIKGGNDIE